MHSHFCAAYHKRIAHIVSRVAYVNEFDFIEGFRNVFPYGQEVGKNLRRMIFVGKTVPDGNSAEAGKILHNGLLETSVFYSVVETTENLRGVFETFFLTHLAVAEISNVSAFVGCRNFERTTRSRAGLIENKNYVLTVERFVSDTEALFSLEILSKIEHITDFVGSEILKSKKTSSF